jgi:hypothetical protein
LHSLQQHKKLQKAHAKGKAATMMFDPFQIQSHQYLRGKGAMVMKSPHMKGGTTAKDWLMNQYNEQIPEAYHPGLESIGRAGLSQMGFGLKKRGRPRKMKGGDIFEDMLDGLTNAGRQMLSVAPKTPVSDYLINEYTVDKTGEAEKSRKRAEQYRKEKAMKGKGNIMEDFGDASQKFLQGAMRDTPDWLKGPEKDPLAFMYGGEVGDGLKKPKMVKGSPEAKAFMAAMRAKRGKKSKGGSLTAEPPRSRMPVTDPSLL